MKNQNTLNPRFVFLFISFFEFLKERDKEAHSQFTMAVREKAIRLFRHHPEFLVLDSVELVDILICWDRKVRGGLNFEDLRRVGQAIEESGTIFCIHLASPDEEVFFDYRLMSGEAFAEWFYDDIEQARVKAS